MEQTKQVHFWGFCIIPWLVFLSISGVFTFLFSVYTKTCGLCSCIAFLASLLLWTTRTKDRLYGPLALLMVLANVLGIIVGLYNYDTNEILAGYYYYARHYNNVVPSESSVGLLDAGMIDFTKESSVDIGRSVGYKHQGVTYCVAPVIAPRNGDEKEVVQYWATGLGCCGAKSNFWCDDSKLPTAHSAAVVFQNHGWFAHSNKKYYEKAMNKAVAQHKMVTTDNPLFVRWTLKEKKAFLRDQYHKAAIFTFTFINFIYGLISYMLGVACIKKLSERHSSSPMLTKLTGDRHV